MTNRKQKTMYNLLPAGSVMHFEIITVDRKRAIDSLQHRFHLGNFTDMHQEYGLGLTIMGGITQ